MSNFLSFFIKYCLTTANDVPIIGTIQSAQRNVENHANTIEDTKMTIAQQIKSFHIEIDRTGAESVKNDDDFVAECEQKAVDIEQDDAESTTYEFVDGSVIVWSNAEVFVYGSRN